MELRTALCHHGLQGPCFPVPYSGVKNTFPLHLEAIRTEGNPGARATGVWGQTWVGGQREAWRRRQSQVGDPRGFIPLALWEPWGLVGKATNPDRGRGRVSHANLVRFPLLPRIRPAFSAHPVTLSRLIFGKSSPHSRALGLGGLSRGWVFSAPSVSDAKAEADGERPGQEEPHAAWEPALRPPHRRGLPALLPS